MKRGSAYKALRREDAELRHKERQKRTPQTQLALLDAKLGVGQGAVKERQRLTKMIESLSVSKHPATDKKTVKPKSRASRRAERNRRKNKQ